MMNKANPLFSLSNAGVWRGGKWLVRNVDLSISRNEIVTLIGPNGSGKSTTAKMALGILSPDEGTAKQAARLKVGYVPQNLSIDWSLPLKVSRFMQLTNKLDTDTRDWALEATGITNLLNAELGNLSGGEFQRALIARAIARKPDLLVLDEPVQGVDFSGQIALYDLIHEMRDMLGCGILMISHDLNVVMASTDRVLCLNGHVCCSGTPTAVAANESYQTLFGPQANVGLALYEHNHNHTHLPNGRVMHADGSVSDHCDGHEERSRDGSENKDNQERDHHAG